MSKVFSLLLILDMAIIMIIINMLEIFKYQTNIYNILKNNLKKKCIIHIIN